MHAPKLRRAARPEGFERRARCGASSLVRGQGIVAPNHAESSVKTRFDGGQRGRHPNAERTLEITEDLQGHLRVGGTFARILRRNARYLLARYLDGELLDVGVRERWPFGLGLYGRPTRAAR